MRKSLTIALVGHGSIAGYVVEHMLATEGIVVSGLVCREISLAKAHDFAAGRFPVVTAVNLLEFKPDLLVDCAGHTGLLAHAPLALENGIEVISISTGALSDPQVAETLEKAAEAGNSRIRFLSGAVGGIDALVSASADQIDEVVYTGRKPPKGWMGSAAEEKCDLSTLTAPFEHFSGSAREAAKLYPKNANVAATIALASLGLDRVNVRLIADPNVEQNIHEIDAKGVFGTLNLTVKGNPLPSNPKSSALAAMSVVGELKQRVKRIGI